MSQADAGVPFRAWVILMLAMWAGTADSWYRISFAMMAPSLSSEAGLGFKDVGYAFSLYAAGLAVGSVVMPVLIALRGVRPVYGAAILGGSLAMTLTGEAHGLGWLMVARACQGFFGGAILVGGMQVVAEWFPPRLSGVATGLFLGSVQLSLLSGPPVVIWLLKQFERSHTSFLLAGLGLLAFPFWVLLGQPPHSERPDTRAVLRELSEVFRTPQTLALLLGVALLSPIAQFDVGELLNHQHNVDLRGLGWLLFVPMALAAVGALLGGVVSDLLIRLGWPPLRSRRSVALALALITLLFLGVLVPNTGLIIILAGLSQLGYQGCCTVLFAAVADSAPKRGLAFAVLLAGLLSSGSYAKIARPLVVARWGYLPVVIGLVVLAAIAVAVLWHFLRQTPETTEELGTPAEVRVVGPHGGFGRRFAAFVLDIVICATPIGIGAVIARPQGESTVLMILLALTLQWLYFAGLESSTSQATLGKRALGVFVTDELGQRISFRRASLRYFGKILSLPLAVGFLIAAFTEHGQALHDLITRCVVVRKPVTGV